ncbi:MAG: hypothetical protein EXX96DRAFT_605429 [Benjaminiella poitrasii]|nr:MAG: hypothetical protein EXX96DRAFT_605429 [Benjaminiella poitrasii]
MSTTAPTTEEALMSISTLPLLTGSSPVLNNATSYFPSSLRRAGTSSTLLSSDSSTNSTPQQQRSPVSTLKYDYNNKRWRWWHILAFFIMILIMIEVVVLNKHYKLLHQDYSSIRIVKRQYPYKSYTHLDTNAQSQLEKGTRVYHVTKEFGPATLTDVGRTVTALAAAQQASNLTEVAVVMPFYTFMRRLITDKEIDMVMDIRGKKPNQIMTVEFRVWKMLHVFNPPVQAPSKYEWQMINNVNTSVLITPQRPPQPTDAIPVYMIGHANRKPFNKAFRCRTVDEIYDENELPNEWRDQYFAKAAAAFLAHKATASDEESIFAPIRIVPRVDIVHVHGASNAYVAKFLHDKRDAEDLGPRPPAIVYTMHDRNEVQYTNSFKNVRKFLDHPSEHEMLRQYGLGGKMFMTKFALDRADAVTVVSRWFASDIVEGRYDFYLKELVMDNLLKQVERSRFYGISNGVDYHSTEHPFITDKLVNRSMVFPSYAWELIKHQELIHAPNSVLALEVPEAPTYWTLSERPTDFIYVYKHRAKQYLIKRNLLTQEDIHRPIVLFRGNFEKRRGLEILDKATELFEKYDMRFIIMGNKKDYPFDRLEALQKQYPNHVLLIPTAKQQRQYGIFCRAAADFVFMPDGTQDGYKLAEGLIFGSAAITPRLGPLSNAIIDRSQAPRKISVAHLDPEVISERGAVVTGYEYYNSYVYKDTTLASAIGDAYVDYHKLRKNKALREEYVLRMIRSAINLGWDRGHFKGPVHEYNRVYELALEDRFIPEMKRHEVEQENELVSRLQDNDFEWE